jgi:hypothetical protein
VGLNWGVGGLVDATLAYVCPTCKAGVGKVCTYKPNAYATDLRRFVDREGLPTKSPHATRYQVMHEYQGTQSQVARNRERKAYKNAQLYAIQRRKWELRSVRAAMRDYDVNETHQLRVWLADFADILCT